MQYARSHKIFNRKSTCLILIDFQEKLIPAISGNEAVSENIVKLLKAFNILKIPVFYTEQNPEKLGKTPARIKDLITQPDPYVKTTFSIIGLPKLWEQVREHGLNSVVLAGIESHVCVTQSALDLYENGLRVSVPQDCTGSRHIHNYQTAMNRLRSAGIDITCVESVIFELIDDYTIPEFKDVLKILK